MIAVQNPNKMNFADMINAAMNMKRVKLAERMDALAMEQEARSTLDPYRMAELRNKAEGKGILSRLLGDTKFGNILGIGKFNRPEDYYAETLSDQERGVLNEDLSLSDSQKNSLTGEFSPLGKELLASIKGEQKPPTYQQRLINEELSTLPSRATEDTSEYQAFQENAERQAQRYSIQQALKDRLPRSPKGQDQYTHYISKLSDAVERRDEDAYMKALANIKKVDMIFKGNMATEYPGSLREFMRAYGRGSGKPQIWITPNGGHTMNPPMINGEVPPGYRPWSSGWTSTLAGLVNEDRDIAEPILKAAQKDITKQLPGYQENINDLVDETKRNFDPDALNPNRRGMYPLPDVPLDTKPVKKDPAKAAPKSSPKYLTRKEAEALYRKYGADGAKKWAEERGYDMSKFKE